MLRPRFLPILGTVTVKIRTHLASSSLISRSCMEMFVELRSEAESRESESSALMTSAFISAGGFGASKAGGV